MHLQRSTKPVTGAAEQPSPRCSWEPGRAAYLRGVDLSLDDVEDGDVAVAGLPLPSGGHHHVLGLQKPPHHVQHRGFPHTSHLGTRRGEGGLSLNINWDVQASRSTPLTDWSVVRGV